MGAKRRPAKSTRRHSAKRRKPTAEQQRQWDRDHAFRLELITRPFVCLRTREFGRSYLWAGVLIPREAELIKDHALGTPGAYHGAYGDRGVPSAIDWDNIVSLYEGK